MNISRIPDSFLLGAQQGAGPPWWFYPFLALVGIVMLVIGTRQGTPGGDEQELIAKPGYAIGAIHARVGLVLNALQLVYYRIDGQRLDPADQYESEWVGCDGGGLHKLNPMGDPITGIFGNWQDDIVSLGVQPAHSLWASVPLSRTGEPKVASAVPSPAELFREWRSADAKFSVEAKLIGNENGNVRLQRRDGSIMNVPVARLSEADTAYLREK